MRNFNRGNNKFGGGRDFKRRDFDRRDSSDRFLMHKTTCSKCGNECEVPFRPTGEKPVFCNNCFRSEGGSDSKRFEGRNDSRRFGERTSGRSRFNDNRMYEAVCDIYKKECKVPFQPTSGKPIYCNKCFEDKKNNRANDVNLYKEQFEILNAKLDKILKVLTPTISTDGVQKEKTAVNKKSQPKKNKTKKELKKESSTSKTIII